MLDRKHQVLRSAAMGYSRVTNGYPKRGSRCGVDHRHRSARAGIAPAAADAAEALERLPGGARGPCSLCLTAAVAVRNASVAADCMGERSRIASPVYSHGLVRWLVR